MVLCKTAMYDLGHGDESVSIIETSFEGLIGFVQIVLSSILLGVGY